MAEIKLENEKFLITDSNYADKAKKIMKQGKKEKKVWFSNLSTTKLRGIYDQIVTVYSEVFDDATFNKAKGDVQYLKVKMAYEAGRYNEVKNFLNDSNLLELLDNVNNYEKFELYSRYAESLVAYFKFYGGDKKNKEEGNN